MTTMLATLYSTLAAKSLTFGTFTITGTDTGATHNAYTTADLPVRLFAPFDGMDDLTLKVMGRNSVSSTALHTIVEWMLAEKVGQTRGNSDIVPNLKLYRQAYLQMMSDAPVMGLSGQKIQLQRVNLKEQLINFPITTDDYYYGVVATLEFLEVIN